MQRAWSSLALLLKMTGKELIGKIGLIYKANMYTYRKSDDRKTKQVVLSFKGKREPSSPT